MIVEDNEPQPGHAWPGRQPWPAGRPRHRDHFSDSRDCGEAAVTFSMIWCPRPLVLPCWSIRLIVRLLNSCYETSRKLHAPSDCKFRSSTKRAAAGKSRRPSPRSCATGPTHSSLAPDAFFGSRRVRFATLATHYRIPAVYSTLELVEAGGLMSYGSNLADAFRQSAKFELVINAQTARMLGLELPPTLLARADGVIE
jgi:hypothetical protein